MAWRNRYYYLHLPSEETVGTRRLSDLCVVSGRTRRTTQGY